MSHQSPSVFLYLLALTLGLRHGIDWDHIAAITDITGTSEKKGEAIILGMLYILGHASIIVLLGFLSVVLGVTLPTWVDKVMERVIGTTLILLGIWLLTSILLHGKNFRMKSSRIFLLEQSLKLFNWIHSLIPHHHHKHKQIALPDTVTKRSAFVIGTIHGIGAETPTQVLLFVTAAGVGKGLFGSLLVLIFVAGLITSNFIITLLSITGFAEVNQHPILRIGLGTITGVFSLIVGVLFLLNKAGVLPAILGG